MKRIITILLVFFCLNAGAQSHDTSGRANSILVDRGGRTEMGYLQIPNDTVGYSSFGKIGRIAYLAGTFWVNNGSGFTALTGGGGGSGTVTSITATSPLTGGVITTSGSIGLGTTGTPGTYGSATIVPVLTTDVYGRVTGVTNTTIAPPFSAITGKPTTIAGYGITDPIVYTSGSYSDPSWITALAWSKITSTPTTLAGYGIADAYTKTASDARFAPIAINGTVTSVAATAGTGINISGSPITTSGTLTITNTAPDQTVVLNNGTGISVTGIYPNFTVTNTSPSSGGTVTSVSGTAGQISSTGGATPVIALVTANATPSTYGSGTTIPVIAVDAYGRATTVTTATNTPAYANVTGTPTIAVTINGVSAANNTAVTVNPVASSVTSAMIVDGTIVNGDISGSAAIVYGKLSLAASIVATTDLNATGTPSATTFLRGDNTWATPAGGGGGNTKYVASSASNTVDSSSAPTYTINSVSPIVYTATVNLTSAAILSLNTTPVTIVAAQGVGTIIVPIFSIWNLTYVSTTYSANALYLFEGATINSPSNNMLHFLVASRISNTSSAIFYGLPYPVATVNGIYETNTALKIGALVNPTTGNGTIKVTVYYYILTP